MVLVSALREAGPILCDVKPVLRYILITYKENLKTFEADRSDIAQ